MYHEPLEIEITADGELGVIERVTGRLHKERFDGLSDGDDPIVDVCTWKFNWAVTTASDWYWGQCRWTPSAEPSWLDVEVIITVRRGRGWVATKINGVEMNFVGAGAAQPAGVEEGLAPPTVQFEASDAESPLEQAWD